MALVLQFWDFYWDFGNFYREINHKQVSLQFLMEEVLLHCGTAAVAAPDYLKRKRFPKA